MSSSLDIFQHNPSKFPTAKLEKQQNFNFLNYQMPKNLLQNSELREKLQKFTLAICWRSIKIDDMMGPNLISLFVFSLSDPKQNARSLLTPVSGTVFYALSHGSLAFALHGSFFNHLLIG